jgi:hypothetical protein
MERAPGLLAAPFTPIYPSIALKLAFNMSSKRRKNRDQYVGSEEMF